MYTVSLYIFGARLYTPLVGDSELPRDRVNKLQRMEEKTDSQTESAQKDENPKNLPVLPPKPIGLDLIPVAVEEHGSNNPTVPPKPPPRKPLDGTGKKTSTRPPEVAPRTKIYSNPSELLSSDTRRNEQLPAQFAPRSSHPANCKPDTPPKSVSVSKPKEGLVDDADEYEVLKPIEQVPSEKLNRSRKLQFKEIGKKMTLKEFCFQNKSELPCLIKVTQGYRSLSERYSLGTDQLFVVIEMKEIDTVRAKSAQGDETQYDVPLQSDAFTVLPSANPQYNTERIIRPLQFLECNSLPKVIQAASNITTVKGRKIQSGTLLFPQEVKKKAKRLEKRILVARLEDGSIVDINSECGGGFIVSRSAADNLSLSTAAKCIKLPFECTLKPVEDDIFCDHVTIESVRKELFLFGVMKVSDGSIHDDVNSFKQLSEVPGNLEISVIVMVPEKEEVLEDIYESAQSYYNVNTMSKGSKKKPLAIASVEESARIQSPDHNLIGPYVSMVPTTRTLESQQQYSEIMTSAPPKSPPSKIEYYSKSDVHTPRAPVSEFKKTVQSRPLPCIPLATVSGVPTERTTPESSPQLYDSADDIVAPHYKGLTVVGGMNDDGKPFTTARKQPDEMELYSTLPNSSNTAANICNLKLLDPVGVLNLLDAMNLSVYKENFRKELIDGEILSEFTEEMFIELGVEKGIHRLRLMHVVKGRKDVSSLLNVNVNQKQAYV